MIGDGRVRMPLALAYILGRGRPRRSPSVKMWLRVMSLSLVHPPSAMVSSNSSRIMRSTFRTPGRPPRAPPAEDVIKSQRHTNAPTADHRRL